MDLVNRDHHTGKFQWRISEADPGIGEVLKSAFLKSVFTSLNAFRGQRGWKTWKEAESLGIVWKKGGWGVNSASSGERKCWALLPGILWQVWHDIPAWEWLKAAPGKAQIQYQELFLYWDDPTLEYSRCFRFFWIIPLVWFKVWNLTGVFQSLKDGYKEEGESPFHGEDKEQWGQGELAEVLSQY